MCFGYTESNPALTEVIEESASIVQSEFGALLVYARKQLEENVSPDDFRTFALSICPVNCIKSSSNVDEMFDTITCNKGWSYQHYRSLKNILRKSGITDPKTNKKFADYTQSLHSYNVTILIVDWIKKKKLDKKCLNSVQSPPPPDCDELSVKLYPCKVIDKTLQYVKELWEAIAEDLLELPDLDAVLYDIKEGCLFITWLIPAREGMKQLIRRRVSCCEEFLKGHNIALFMLNKECVCPEQVRVSHWEEMECINGSTEPVSFLPSTCTYVVDIQVNLTCACEMPGGRCIACLDYCYKYS